MDYWITLSLFRYIHIVIFYFEVNEYKISVNKPLKWSSLWFLSKTLNESEVPSMSLPSSHETDATASSIFPLRLCYWQNSTVFDIALQKSPDIRDISGDLADYGVSFRHTSTFLKTSSFLQNAITSMTMCPIP